MDHYLITFPSAAMVVSEAEYDRSVEESHAVVRAAKAAGVWVFGDGIDESIAPVRVTGDGALEPADGQPWVPLTGGFTVLRTPTREVALEWAARIAAACRCPQEVRAFHYDPES